MFCFIFYIKLYSLYKSEQEVKVNSLTFKSELIFVTPQARYISELKYAKVFYSKSEIYIRTFLPESSIRKSVIYNNNFPRGKKAMAKGHARF